MEVGVYKERKYDQLINEHHAGYLCVNFFFLFCVDNCFATKKLFHNFSYCCFTHVWWVGFLEASDYEWEVLLLFARVNMEKNVSTFHINGGGSPHYHCLFSSSFVYSL